MALGLPIGTYEERKIVVRYRGFLLLQEHDQSWLVRPERSPMLILPFRTKRCSLNEVKKILIEKLSQQREIDQAA